MKKITMLLLVVVAATTTLTAFAAQKTSTSTDVMTLVVYADSDWDSILDDFEEYVDDYAALMAKYKAGDMSAMTEAFSMLETANSLSKKLDSADDELTQEQMTRYLKILKKLSDASLSMM